MKFNQIVNGTVKIAVVLGTLLWLGCPSPTGGGGGGGGGGGISMLPISSISGAITSGSITGYNAETTGSFSYDFAGTGKSVFFGFLGMDPAAYIN